jgi:filamentous hemagglutinin
VNQTKTQFKILLALCTVWTGVQALELIADPSADLGFRPSIGTSPNNVPVIDIAPPSAGGVSLNKFTSFNIGSEGLIHNNSLTSGSSSLGGALSANSRLSVAASIIIDEVTSSNSSTLLGKSEIFGKAAKLIIANPNGISCNGCSFVNSPRVTITTAAPTLSGSSSNIISLAVTQGVITISGDGVSADDNQRMDLIARELLIQGPVYDSNRIDIISGGGTYDYSNSSGEDPNSYFTESSLSATGSTYQIDASILGEISAGKINIIGTDDGIGVRLLGGVTSSRSNIVIDSDGNLSVDNISSAKDLTLKTGSANRTMSLLGTINTTRDMTIDSSGSITQSEAIKVTRKLTVDANSNIFDNSSSTIEASDINISEVTTFTNDGGTINAKFNAFIYEVPSSNAPADLNALVAKIAEQINNHPGFGGITAYPTSDSTGVITLTLDTNAQGLTFAPTVPITGSDTQTFTLTGSGSTRTLTISGDIETSDSFKLVSNGNISITATSLSNNATATIKSYGTASINASTLTNAGVIASEGSLNFGSSSSRITSFSSSGSSAEVKTSGTLDIYTSGAISNASSSVISSEGALTIDSRASSGGPGTLTQSASILSDATINISATTINTGIIKSVGNLNFGSSSSRITSFSSSGSSAEVKTSGTLDIYTSGAISNASSSIISSEGALTINSSAGTLTQSASILSDATINISAVTINTGIIKSVGNLNFGSSSSRITSFSSSGSSAEVKTSGTLDIYTSGAISNLSSSTILASQAITLDSSGDDITQTASLEGLLDVTLNAQDISLSTSSSNKTKSGEDLTLAFQGSGQDFAYTGQQIYGNQSVTLNVNDDFTNSSHLSVTGDLFITADTVITSARLVAGDDLTITTTGVVTNNSIIFAADTSSGGTGLVIDAGGAITNAASKSIYALGDVVLVSNVSIDNNDGSVIESGGDLTLATVTGQTISNGSVSSGTTVGGSYIYNTEGNITSTGTIAIQTATLKNWRGSDDFPTTVVNGGYTTVRGERIGTADHRFSSKIYSSQAIPAGKSRANLNSRGDLSINASTIQNRASTIESRANISITTTGDLTNEVIILTQIKHFKDDWSTLTVGGYSSSVHLGSNTCTSGDDCFGETDLDTNALTTDGPSYIRAADNLTQNLGGSLSNTGDIEADSVSVTAVSIENGLDTDSTYTISSNSLSGLNAANANLNAVSLTFDSLSNLNALYTIDTSGTSQYLISPSISIPGQQLSQSYLFDQLGSGAGSTLGLTFLADPFVENQLLQQAALESTGSNFVLENVDANQNAQRQALYDNAVIFANEAPDITIGQAFTQTQIEQLTVPVLWYVTENVGGQNVLVPTLYLPTADNIEITAQGQIIASNSIVLQAEESIINTGNISAGTTVVLQAQDITNQTLTTQAQAQTGSGSVGYTTAGPSANISGSTVILIAQSDDENSGNVTNVGGNITSTSSEGQVVIQTSGDVVNTALVVEQVDDVDVGNFGSVLGKQDYVVHEEYVSGNIGGEGNVTIISEGEVLNIASNIDAQGDILISADEGFTQQNLAHTYVTEDSVDLFGSGSTSTSASASASGEGYSDFEASAETSAGASGNIVSGAYSEGVENQSASVSGANVTIYSSEGDITSIGSSITSSGETILFAEDGSINLLADALITNSSNWSVSTGASAEAHAGGSGVNYNAGASASVTQGFDLSAQQEATFIDSSVGGENVTLIAGNDIIGVGAQIDAANNLALDAGNNVSFTAAQEQVSNFSLSLSNTQSVYAEAGTTAGNLGLPDAKAGVQNEATIGASWGDNTSSSASNLTAGNNISISAGNDLELIGTNISGGGNVALSAVNDVLIQALEESSSQVGVSASAGGGFECTSGGCGPTASSSFGFGSESGSTFTESSIESGGNFSISAGGDATLTGVNVASEGDTSIVASSVTIASAQDTIQSIGFGISSSPLATVTSNNSTNGNENASPLAVNFQQTNAIVTNEQAQLNTAGNLIIVATEGNVDVLSINADIEGNAALLAQQGDVTIGDLQDTVDTTSVAIDLSVETGLEDTVSDLADGLVNAIETGDVGSIVGAIPGVNKVAQAIAAIESGDLTQIAGAIGGQALGGVISAVDQYALDGAISDSAQGTGSNVGSTILDFTSSGGDSQASILPSDIKTPGLPSDLVGSTAGTNVLAGINIDGSNDARLGVTVTQTESSTSAGSVFNVEGNLTLDASNDVNVVGSNISVAGDTSLIAGNVVNLVAGQNTFDSETIEAGITVGFDVVNQDVKVGVDAAYSETNSTSVTNSNLTTGGTLNIVSGSDTNILSTNVVANDIDVTTGGDLNISTIQSTLDTQEYSADLTVEVGITGDSGAGELNFEGATGSQSTTGEQASLVALNNLNIDSSNDINITSSIVGAGNTANIVAAGDVTVASNIDAANNESFGGTVSVSANQQGEDSGSGGSGEVSFNYGAENEANVGSQSVIFGGDNLNITAGNDLTLADAIATGDSIELTAGNDVNILTTQNTADNFSVGAELAVGGSQTGSEGQGEDSGEFAAGFNFGQGDSATIQEQGSVSAGSNLIINSGGDTNITGSTVSSGGDATLNVEGDLTVTTLQDTNDQLDIEANIAAGGGNGGEDSANGGAQIGASFEDTNSTISNTVAGIYAANNLSITTEGDTTLTGSVVQGGTVDVEIGGDLTITSLQDIEDTIGAGFDLGAGSNGGDDAESGSGNIQIGANVNYVDSQETNVVSGIFATEGDLNATVEGNTSLTGSVIASTAEDGQTNLSTGSLTVTDLQDSTTSFDAGFDFSAANDVGNSLDNDSVTVTQDGSLNVNDGGDYTPGDIRNSQHDNGIQAGANLNVFESSGTTQSTIGQGNLVIGNGEEVEVNQDLSTTQTSTVSTDINVGGEISIGKTGVSASGNVGDAEASFEVSRDGASANATDGNGNSIGLSATPVGGAELSLEVDGETIIGEPEQIEADEPSDEETSSAQSNALAAAQDAIDGAGSNAEAAVSDPQQTSSLLSSLQVGSQVTTEQAQTMAQTLYNGGNPAASPELQGLSPAQQILVLQTSRIWLSVDQQRQLDIVIQQITTGIEASPR